MIGRYAKAKLSGQKPKGIDKFEEVVKSYLSPSKDAASHVAQTSRKSDASFEDISAQRFTEMTLNVKSNRALSMKIDWRFAQPY